MDVYNKQISSLNAQVVNGDVEFANKISRYCMLISLDLMN